MKKFIGDIKPYSAIGITIRVRVMIQWRPRVFDSPDYNGLHYLLVDEKGSSIHAMIEECYYPHIENFMKVGKIYEVSRFAAKRDPAWQRLTEHDAILCFTEFTKFEEIQEELPNFPNYSFNLRTYGQLAAEAGHQTVLADLYGCIKAVKAPQVVAVDNPKGKETRTDVSIQLIGREELRICLWADVARSFPVQEITDLPPPVFAVFTGMKLTTFGGHVSASSTVHTWFVINPDIKEKEQYQTEFSKNGDRLSVTGVFSSLMSPGMINEADKRNVSQLNMLNPTVDVAKSVYSTARVRRFFVDKEWFFRCCPVDKCYKHMSKKNESDNQYVCPTHDDQIPKITCKVYVVIQDAFDQARVILMGKPADEFFGATCEDILKETGYAPGTILPARISSMIGQEFIFEIRISQRGELFVRSSRKNDLSTATKEGGGSGSGASGTKQLLEIVGSKEPIMDTPEKLMHERKRGSQTVQKELFGSSTEKKTKRNQDVGSSSAKNGAEKKQEDMEKKLK